MTSVIFRKSNNSVFLSDTPMHSLTQVTIWGKTTRRISILNQCFQLVLTVKQSHSNKATTKRFLHISFGAWWQRLSTWIMQWQTIWPLLLTNLGPNWGDQWYMYDLKDGGEEGNPNWRLATGCRWKMPPSSAGQVNISTVTRSITTSSITIIEVISKTCEYLDRYLHDNEKGCQGNNSSVWEPLQV